MNHIIHYEHNFKRLKNGNYRLTGKEIYLDGRERIIDTIVSQALYENQKKCTKCKNSL